ncbi:MAG: tyrosine-type recombinase/integrase [Treponema sp.]|jgi:site-specific recombinase XerD|nr:tyrosine-type recombinase/integrase [Treponema sp.]
MLHKVEFAAYREWLNRCEKTKITIEKNIRDIVKFRVFCGKCLSEVTKQDILDYKDYLIGKYKPASVNSYLISLNNFLKFTAQDSLRVKTVKIQRRNSLDNVLTEADYAALLECAKKRENKRLYYLIRTLTSSGIRVGELQYITAEILETGKTYAYGKNKMREIIIPQSLCAELEKYCGEQHITGLIFHGKQANTLIDKARIWRELKQLAKAAGVSGERVHAHNFRHFFAKRFLSEYHDIVDLADILGHNSVETTRIYTRTSSQEKQARIDALNL